MKKNKIMNILKKINYIKVIIVELYIVLAQLVWHCKEYVLLDLMKVKQNSIQYYVYVFGLGAVLTIILIAIIIKLINPRKNNKGIVNIGLKNSIGEYPRQKKIFKDKTKDNRIVIKLETRNVPLTGFQDKQDDLETVYNIKIDYITYAPRTTKYVLIYGTPMKYLKPKEYGFSEDSFLRNIKNELIMGKTRSGKTVFAKIQLANMGKELSSFDNIVEIYIADFKNEDFIELADTKNYYGYLNAVDGINKVHSIMLERIENKDNRNDRSTIILLIDEYSTLLSELPKKEAEELQKKVGAILRSGASKNIIPIIIDQEAYSNTFPNAKHQFRTLVCFGNLEETQKDMLLKDYKSQIKEINKCGEAYVYQDGEEDLTRIRVIKRDDEENIIMNEIRSKMG